MAKAVRVKPGEQREVVKLFRSLTNRHSPWTVWSDFVTMVACSISSATDQEHREHREKLYADTSKKYKPAELEIFAQMFAEVVMGMDRNPDQDFLGELFMQLELSNQHRGQFFTPYHVCRLMSAITNDDLKGRIERDGWISVNDCCCGAGALLIAFANECMRPGIEINYQTSVLFVAQDIDFTVAMMCYIQLSLLGCAGYVVVGNSITEPSTSLDRRGLIPKPGDNVWPTPMYFRDVWHWRRIFALVDASISSKAPTPNAEESPTQEPEKATEAEKSKDPEYDVQLNTDKHGQITFF